MAGMHITHGFCNNHKIFLNNTLILNVGVDYLKINLKK